jgi:hypothetical protein
LSKKCKRKPKEFRRKNIREDQGILKKKCKSGPMNFVEKKYKRGPREFCEKKLSFPKRCCEENVRGAKGNFLILLH